MPKAKKSANSVPETIKLSIPVTKETHDRILAVLGQVKDYRGKIVYFGQDAVVNELLRAETAVRVGKGIRELATEEGQLAPTGADIPQGRF